MALDEPKDTDTVFDIDGFTYIVDKAFIEKVQPVKVDYAGYGFKVSAAVEFGSGECSACSTSGKCH